MLDKSSDTQDYRDFYTNYSDVDGTVVTKENKNYKIGVELWKTYKKQKIINDLINFWKDHKEDAKNHAIYYNAKTFLLTYYENTLN